MGELLDSLNAIDTESVPRGEPPPAIEPMSVIDEATERVIGRPIGIAHRRDTAIGMVTGWVRQAPLQSLAVAFLLGAAFSRRLR